MSYFIFSYTETDCDSTYQKALIGLPFELWGAKSVDLIQKCIDVLKQLLYLWNGMSNIKRAVSS